MRETKTCPKCGGKMRVGRLFGRAGIHKDIAWGNKMLESQWDRVLAYACKKCGYIETYLELKRR